MLTRTDIRFNEYILRFALMFRILPLGFDPTTGQLYQKDNNLLGKSVLLGYQIVLGCFSIFGAYRSIDFIVFSDWDPILSPTTLATFAIGIGAVVVMQILLTNLHKGVKIYNGLFNLNEDKGSLL